MSSREQMLEATVDLLAEGVIVLDVRANVLFCNEAAAALSGYAAHDILGRPCPDDLYRIEDTRRPALSSDAPEPDLTCPTLVSITHRLGHAVPAMLRRIALRDPLGNVAGASLLFYPAEETDALPHGETGDGAMVERSQAEMEDRLDAAQHQWTVSHMPFGLLWITVDQAQSLRRTHGKDACESMLHTVEQTLRRQMGPAEVLGRWGDNEFLALTHQRTAALLMEHGSRLLGLARTADFRWWGDRVALSLSIGAGQAAEGDTLKSVLARAQHAMQSSQYAGGNCIGEGRAD